MLKASSAPQMQFCCRQDARLPWILMERVTIKRMKNSYAGWAMTIAKMRALGDVDRRNIRCGPGLQWRGRMSRTETAPIGMNQARTWDNQTKRVPREIDAIRRCLTAHNGLVAGSSPSPARPTTTLANVTAPARRLSAAYPMPVRPFAHSQRQFRRQRLTPDRVKPDPYRMCGGSHGSPSPLAERYT